MSHSQLLENPCTYCLQIRLNTVSSLSLIFGRLSSNMCVETLVWTPSHFFSIAEGNYILDANNIMTREIVGPFLNK